MKAMQQQPMSISSEEDVASKASRSPSRLLFDEDDSSSEHSSTSARRRCSFVSNSDRPNVMDIRSNYPDSVCGRSYDLSICSDDGDMSSNTLQTDDLALERMGMFEIALSAGLKKNATDNDVSRSDSGHASTNTAATTGRLMTKLSRSFSSTKRRSSAPGLVLPTSGYAVSPPGETLGDNDYSAAKKIKATPQRKAYRYVQAAGLFALISTLVGSFLLLELSDIDPSSIISRFAAKTSSILENLVTSSLGPAATEEETKRYQGPEELGEKRMMTQEVVPSVNEMIPPQELPINTKHEYDKMFIQAFRNHQNCHIGLMMTLCARE
jgi:hypothetical protein